MSICEELCGKHNKRFRSGERCPECDYVSGDLLTCSRILRGDMALRADLGNGRLDEGRMLVSVSQELWNNWCAAIGDRA